MSVENLSETSDILATPMIAFDRARANVAVRVAILIPCYNEEGTVGEVVKQFQAQLPAAAIYVFDNNSTDQTAAGTRRMDEYRGVGRPLVNGGWHRSRQRTGQPHRPSA